MYINCTFSSQLVLFCLFDVYDDCAKHEQESSADATAISEIWNCQSLSLTESDSPTHWREGDMGCFYIWKL